MPRWRDYWRSIPSGSIFRSSVSSGSLLRSIIRSGVCRRRSMWRGRTAKVPQSRSCVRPSKRPARRFTSTPRPIWSVSTSVSGLAKTVAASWSDDAELGEALAECEAKNGGAPITVFEMETAAAFLLFSRHPADLTLLEVGLGGRLDATNVIERPLASVITRVSLDHREFLGDLLAEIAAEKAGIIKPHVPAIIAGQDARSARRDRAAGGAATRAASNCRRKLDRDRGARPAGLSRRGWATRSAGAQALRPTSVRECRRRYCGAAGEPDSNFPPPRTKRPWSASIGRRACSGFRTAGLPIWRLRAAKSGSTVGIIPMADRRLRLPLPISRSACRGPSCLIVGMLSTKDCAGFLKNFSGLARRVITVPIHQEKTVPAVELAEVAGKDRDSGAGTRRSRKRNHTCRQTRSSSGAAHPHYRLALSCRRGVGGKRYSARVTALGKVATAHGPSPGQAFQLRA